MKGILLTVFLAVPVLAAAQETHDKGLSFGARATVKADAKLAQGLHLTAHEEYRHYFEGEDLLRFYSGIGLEYKVFPFLKVGGEYELINRYKYDGDVSAHVWSIRHRGSLFLTGTYKTPFWQVSLKETLRLTHRPGDMNPWQSPRNALSLKSKASVKYLGWESVIPFAGFEVRNTLNDAAYSGIYNASADKNKDVYADETFLGYTHAYVNRLRVQLGVTVNFNKHHELDFYLLGDYEREKSIDTNREGSGSWDKHGLMLKSIDWYTGYMISAGIGYQWSF